MMERLVDVWGELNGCVIEDEVVTKENAFVGARVAKGPDWDWGDQNINPRSGLEMYGKILRLDSEDEFNEYWVQVEWENGRGDSYRVYPQRELVFA